MARCRDGSIDMRELYIYYCVRDEASDAARAVVAEMQRELRAAHPGLVARLLTRHGGSGPATWMETYSFAGGGRGIDAPLEAVIALRATALEPFIDGSRHVEEFSSNDAP